MNNLQKMLKIRGGAVLALVSLIAVPALAGLDTNAVPQGVRLRGRLHMNGASTALMWWAFDNASKGGWDGTSIDGKYLFDVGSPKTVKQLGLVLNGTPWPARRANSFTVYGSNDTNDFSTVVFLGNGKIETALVYDGVTTNLFTREDAATTAYRYYQLVETTDTYGYLSYHLLFLSDDFQITQDEPNVLSSSTAGGDDSASGVKFTGEVARLPNGGTGKVKLVVAAKDHDYDYAAWKADATCREFTAETELAEGESYTLYATGLTRGRWYGRVFLEQDTTLTASQYSSEFFVGTSEYIMPIYFANHNNYAAVHQAYDGNVSTSTDGGSRSTTARIIAEVNASNRDIVMIRYWAASSTQWTDVDSFGTGCICVSSEAADFGELTEWNKVTGRTMYLASNDPTADWTPVYYFNQADLWKHFTDRYIEIPVTIPRDTKYIAFRMGGQFHMKELEFRTLPHPMGLMVFIR